MNFYLFEGDTIIAANNEKEAKCLYEKDYDDSYEIVEEIPQDYRVGGYETPNSYSGGYADVLLFQIVDSRKKLPFVVDAEI
jgi:hypothetical protein